MSKQIYAEVTAKIVEQLEKGTAPWVRPWSQTPSGGKSRWFPHNLVSNRDYNGINVVLLSMVGQQYPTGAWATYKQIKEHGGQVRKGEKGVHIVYFGKIEVEDNRESAEPGDTRMVRLLRYFTVFNHAQADWEKDPLAVKGANAEDTSGDDHDAMATIKATGAVIRHGGDQAFYAPGPDSITLPPKKAFSSLGHYFCTAFHELTHWTAHKSRLDRNLTGRFGDKDYAFEELVAELGSAFLCAKHNIDGELRHAEYLGHWIKGLKEDNQAIFKAAALAQKAADFVIGEKADELNQQEAA